MNSTNKPLEIFHHIYSKVRKDENYIPRNYHTIGSFWTVDTWSDGRVGVMLEDEGYTIRIKVPGLLECHTDYKNDMHYVVGSEDDLIELGRIHLP